MAGTQMIDHFEIREHTHDTVLLWCGDSLLNTGVREADGLFEGSACANMDEGVVDFRLKALFLLRFGQGG